MRVFRFSLLRWVDPSSMLKKEKLEVTKMNQNYDLIIRNAMIYTMDSEDHVMEHGSLAIQGDRIAAIQSGDFDESVSAAEVIDAEGMILFPGFINTHIHIFQSFTLQRYLRSYF